MIRSDTELRDLETIYNGIKDLLPAFYCVLGLFELMNITHCNKNSPGPVLCIDIRGNGQFVSPVNAVFVFHLAWYRDMVFPGIHKVTSIEKEYRIVN